MNKFNFKDFLTTYHHDLVKPDNYFPRGEIWKDNVLLHHKEEINDVIHYLDEPVTTIKESINYLNYIYNRINIEWNNQFNPINLSESTSNLLQSLELSRIMRSIYLINDVLITDLFEKYSVGLRSCIVRDRSELSPEEMEKVLVRFPLFFKGDFNIKIPSKVEYAVMKRIPQIKLLEIHSDTLFAGELCLLFISQLTSAYLGVMDGTNPMGWKSLKAQYLRDLLSTGPMIYKKVIKVLKHGSDKGPIIECDNHYIVDEKSYCYRLGSNYTGRGIKSYELKSSASRELLNKSNYRKIIQSQTEPICQNLIAFYNFLTLPTIEEIKDEANRLIKINYVTKKNKKLTKLNKHKKSYFKDAKSLSFVEDSIEIFRYLTEDGLMIPIAGDEKSGGRVVDSFTLMPSWIRKLVKINSKTYTEVDYSCLHPNIAVQIYGGKNGNITHANVATQLDLDVSTVKVEHLSFLNKEIWHMRESPLFDYYSKYDPLMLANIIKEKKESIYGHKITSRRLFAKEVEVMSAVIKKLNLENIFVGYVYDALFCEPKHAIYVKEVMDEIIIGFGILTTAKI